MATNWNAILSNTNNLQDVLSILKKVLASLDIKADITTIDEALAQISSLDADVQEKLSDITAAINKFNNTGGFISAPTLTALQAITPEYNYQLARVDATGDEYRWNPLAIPSPDWEPTGRNFLSESKAYTDQLFNKYFNVVFHDSTTSASNAFSIIFDRTLNLFNASTARIGYRLNEAATIQIEDATYALSDFIAVSVAKKYKRTNGNQAFYVYAFDANKQPVQVDGTKVYWQSAFESTTIPSSVAYVRVLVPTANVKTFMLTESTVNTTSYIPYFQLNKLDSALQRNVILKNTSNLFDKSTALKNYYLASNGLTLTYDERYAISDFIAVEVGKMYKRVGVASDTRNVFVYAYDANKQPVQVDGTKVYWQSAFESTTIPSSVAYVRAIVPIANIDIQMFTESTVDTSVYIPFIQVKPELLPDPTKNSALVKHNEIQSVLNSNKVVTDSRIFENTKNLFNKATKVEGYYGSNGITFGASSTFHCSDFIAVEEGKKYKRVGVTGDVQGAYVYAYDLNKQPVQVDGTIVYWQWAFSSTAIPHGVAYVRVVFNPADTDIYMFTESTVDTSVYIPYVQVKPELLPAQSTTTSQAKYVGGVSELGFVDNQLFNTDYSHIIFYGQSLSMGWESAEALTTTPVDKTWMIGDRVWINQGNNGASVLNPLKASMGSSCGESPAVSAVHDLRLFLDKNIPQNNVDLIATNCGEGGKSIERLSKESTNGANYYNTLFMTAINRAKSIATANSKSISCPAIIWMQGEYNYTLLSGEGLSAGTDATNDKATYKAYLKTLKENMQADIMNVYGQTKKPLFFMYQVGGTYINLDTMPINVAMIEFAEENDDVILMNPTYGVPDYGGGHLSSNGYRWYGEMIAKAMYHSLFKHQRTVTVQAKDFELSEDKKKVLIHCRVPSAPLVIDTYTAPAATSYGFKVVDDTGSLTVNTVKIIGGTTIELTLNRALTTNAYVTYAGKDRSGTGNIRDSERWSSKYFYTDESSYTKKPSYTPKLQDGITPIYNKKYPMQNWLIAFYKKLS